MQFHATCNSISLHTACVNDLFLVRDLLDVLYAAVPVAERRRRRDALAARGAAIGRHKRVKTQSKAAKRSRRRWPWLRPPGLAAVEARFGYTVASGRLLHSSVQSKKFFLRKQARQSCFSRYPALTLEL